MKKSWMIGVMLLGALTAQAQWKITPEAGFNVTKYKYSKAKMGYKVGAAVRYDFGKSGFALQSGLYYVQRGNGSSQGANMLGKVTDSEGREITVVHYFTPNGFFSNSFYKGGYYDNNNNGNSMMPTAGQIEWQSVSFYKNDASRRVYLQLPVLARYTWNVKPNIRIHAALGPYITIGINGKVSGSSTTIDLKSSERSYFENEYNPFDGYENRFDWGIAAETGIEINHFSAKFSYDMGLGNEYKFEGIGIEYHTASFTVGYSF